MKKKELKAYNGVYNRYVKRVIDFLAAVPLFVLLLPVYLVISAAILIDDGLPIFYRPLRGGYRRKNLVVLKKSAVKVYKDMRGLVAENWLVPT